MTGGLLLISRYPWESRPGYRGFDGVAWPDAHPVDVALRDGLASFDDVHRLLAVYRNADDDALDLVYCSSADAGALPEFVFVGLDIGYYSSEYLHFSVILNEILGGRHPRLAESAALLNENLLFASERDAETALRIRKEFAATGADLESGPEPMTVLHIYAIRKNYRQ